jgi:hypothetical protein
MTYRYQVALRSVLFLAALGLLTPASAWAATDCGSPAGGSTSWTGQSSVDSSDFNDPGNWNNGVPYGSCDAFITGASVNLKGGANFAALTLTNASLNILGFTGLNGDPQFSSFQTNNTLVTSGSAIHLSSSNKDLSNGTHPINPGSAYLGGTVVNSGQISTDVGTPGASSSRGIRATVTNNPGGTITMHTDMGGSGDWVNNGTVTTDAGTTTTLIATGAGASFSQSNGTLANSGHFQLYGTVTNSGGSTTGNPVELAGNLDASSSATASFEFDVVQALGTSGGHLTGDIGAHTTVLVHDSGAGQTLPLTLSQSVTNHGVLTLDGAAGTGEDQLLGGSTLTNAGTLNLSQAGTSQIQSPMTNTGTIDLAAGTTVYTAHNRITQQAGSFNIPAGGMFDSNNAFDLTGGTLSNLGTLNAVDFSHTGGSETGNRILLCGGTLTAPGPGAASFDFVDSASCSGGQIANGSTIGSGDDVRFSTTRAQTDVGNGSFTNDGTLTILSTATQQVQFHGVTLTNDGTLNVTGSNIDIALVNDGTANIDFAVGETTNFDPRYGPITQAGGSLNVGVGATLNLGNLTVTGGTIANQGTTAASGDLMASGGQTSGNPPTFASANVTLSGSAAGTYDFLSAAMQSNVIPAGFHLISDGDLRLAAGTTVNSGTIELRGGGAGSSPRIYNGTLDNQGTITTTGAPSITRSVSAAFQSEGTLDVGADLGLANALTSSGTVLIHGGATLTVPGFTQTAGTTTLTSHADALTSSAAVTVSGGTLAGAGIVNADLVNNGTVAPAAATPTLTVNGSYTQGAGGFLATDVEAAAAGTLHVSGATTLAGTLQVSTGSTFAPPKNQTFDVLDAGSISGTFTTTAGLSSGPYSLAYSPTAVTLTAQGRPVPPPTPSLSVSDATVANPRSGTTTATFTITLSPSAATPVTVTYATANGTASGPDDYQATSGTITFVPGQNTATVPVTVYGSAKAGASRTFFLDLGAPNGATLSTARGTGTILGRLSVSSVAPASAGNAGDTQLTISGSGLSSADRITLTAPGRPTITGTGVDAASDGRSLVALVALGGAASGVRDVHLTSGTGLGIQSLPGAFTIEKPVAPDVYPSVYGPKTIRPDSPWFGHVYLYNQGNVDAVNVLVRVDGLPTGSDVSVQGGEGTPTQTDDGEEHSVTTLVPRVGAHGYTVLSVSFPTRDSGIRHLPIVAARATVLKSSDPTLTPDPRLRTTVTKAQMDPDKHFRATVIESTGSGSATLTFDVFAAPPPPGATRTQVTTTHTPTLDTYTIASPASPPACYVPGDGFARVLQWKCGTGVARDWAGGSASLRAHAAGVLWLWEVFHYGHAATEGYAAVTGRGEYKERLALTACLVKDGYLQPQSANVANAEALDGLAWEWTKFGGSVASLAVPVAGQVTVAGAFAALSGDGESTWARRLASSLIDESQNHAASPFGKYDVPYPFRDRRGVGTYYSLPSEVIRDIINEAEVRCYHSERVSERELTGVVSAGDPNDMIGPSGPTGRHYLGGASRRFAYEAHFQNLPSASAAAYRVVVTDKLDTARLDPASVTLGPVTFGSHTITPPHGVQSFTQDIDLRPAHNEVVHAVGAFDRRSAVITWVLSSLDPVSHQPVTDAAAGFLPPDKHVPDGEGTVSFSAAPTAAGVRNGAATRNAATIIFDANNPIVTPTWTNVIDKTRPVSRITKIRGTIATVRRHRLHELVVSYLGQDRESGVGGYDVYVAQGKGARRPVGLDIRSRSLIVTCLRGKRYRFAVVARDRAGNLQARPARSKSVLCR